MLTVRPIFPFAWPAGYAGEPLTVLLGGLTCPTEWATQVSEHCWHMRCTVTGRTYELTHRRLRSIGQLERVA